MTDNGYGTQETFLHSGTRIALGWRFFFAFASGLDRCCSYALLVSYFTACTICNLHRAIPEEFFRVQIPSYRDYPLGGGCELN